MRLVRTGIVAALAAAMLAGASGAGVRDGWSGLRRPLHLPRIAPGARCPVSSVDRRVDWRRAHIFGRAGTGRGPVYPGLGWTHGVLRATRAHPAAVWAGDKVFWYVAPAYRGPVLVRGRRIDEPGAVRFEGRLPPGELRIEATESVTWAGQPPGSRGIPSGVLVRAPGCYAFQLDGTSFSRVVVAAARIAG